MPRQKSIKNQNSKQPTPFSIRQIIRFFDTVDNAKIAVICFLALRCGFRVGDVISLKISSIEWELKRIVKVTQKTKKPMVYHLDNEAIKILKLWVSLLGNTDYLFPSNVNNLEHVTRNGFYTQYIKYLRQANLWLVDEQRSIKNKQHIFNFHSWRSSFASILVNNNVSIFLAKNLLGHSEIRTTERYYVSVGDLALKNELNRIFGKDKNKVMVNEARQQANKEEQPINYNANIPTQKPTLDPLHELEIKLVNGQITPEEFKEKTSLILNLRNQANIKIPTEDNKYIG